MVVRGGLRKWLGETLVGSLKALTASPSALRYFFWDRGQPGEGPRLCIWQILPASQHAYVSLTLATYFALFISAAQLSFVYKNNQQVLVISVVSRKSREKVSGMLDRPWGINQNHGLDYSPSRMAPSLRRCLSPRLQSLEPSPHSLWLRNQPLD